MHDWIESTSNIGLYGVLRMANFAKSIWSAIQWSKQPTKTALAVIITFLISRSSGAAPLECGWSVLAIFMINTNHDKSVYVSKMVVFGTMCGASASILLLLITPHNSIARIIISLAILGFICGKLLEVNPLLSSAGNSGSLLFVIGVSESNSIMMALERVEYIALGISIALIISFIFHDKKSHTI